MKILIERFGKSSDDISDSEDRTMTKYRDDAAGKARSGQDRVG